MNRKASNKRQRGSAVVEKATTKKEKNIIKRFMNWINRHSKGVQALVFILLVGILSISFVAFAVLGYVFSFTNGDKYLDLDTAKETQNQTSIIFATNAKGETYEYQRLFGRENRIWVSLDDMSPYMRDAVVALEDKRFDSHGGVDWQRTISAIVIYGGTQGGSTITQQLVKNLTGDKDVTANRKFHEITHALNVEKHFSKDEIVEAYLNTIYLGEGYYGVKTAAEGYFGKDVKDLTLTECASILSITKAPTAQNLYLNPENNRARMIYCLDEMIKMGTITKEQYDDALKQELKLQDRVGSKSSTSQNAEIYNYYVEYVIDDVVESLMSQYGYSKAKATDMIYYGGLKIYANVNPNVQSVMDRVFTNRETFVEKGDEPSNAQGAMVIMDYDGKVVGIAGGAGKKNGNRTYNRSTDAYRQPGSSIKPLSIYAPAIESGLISWGSRTQDLHIYDAGKKWPVNYTGGYGDGSQVTTQNALVRSLNTVPVRILNQLSVQTSFDFLTKQLPFSYLDKELDLDLSSLALGGMYTGVRVLDMAASYAMFGNGGVYFEPSSYSHVEDPAGDLVLEQDKKGKSVMSEGNAGVMCKMLQGVVTDSAGTAHSYPVRGFQTMVKTGTTSDDWDRWLVGGTPYYISASWYGYDTPKPITNVSGHPAGNFYKKIMDEVHAGLPKKEFALSKNTVQQAYCSVSGLLAGAGCPKSTGWYDKAKLPATCTQHGGAVTTAPAQATDRQADIPPANAGGVGAPVTTVHPTVPIPD